jgi:hypothetical protein
MSDLKKTSILIGVKNVDDPRLLDILEAFRRKLEEGNAFEYWEDVIVVTPSSPNTDFAVRTKYLNKVPSKYLVVKKGAAVDVYDGATAAEMNKIFLKATVADVTITVRIFV